MLTQLYSNLTIAFRTINKQVAQQNPEVVARLEALLEIDRPPLSNDDSEADNSRQQIPPTDPNADKNPATDEKWGQKLSQWFTGTGTTHAKTNRVVLPNNFQWVDAYEAEALLAHLHSAPQVLVELKKAVTRARKRANDQNLYQPELDNLEEELTKATTPNNSATGTATPLIGSRETEALACARALLVQLVMAHNWEKSEKHLKRGFGLRFSKRMARVAPAVVAIFLVVLWILPAARETFIDASGEMGFFANLVNYAGLITVATAGVMGAAFSRLITPISSFENQTLASAILFSGTSLIAVRLTVGGIAAIVLYFFFEAGFFEGLLFPDLERIGFQSLRSLYTGSGPSTAEINEALQELQVLASAGTPVATGEELTEIHSTLSSAIDTSQAPFAKNGRVPNADLSKLLAWSFLAGFSEQLVSKMLNRLESRTKNGNSSST